MIKELTVGELKVLLDEFNDDDIVIVRGCSNGTFAHKIDYISYGKHKYTKDKVCIVGQRS